ncbi:MAG: Aliphatic sulfonates transporter substrate-binding protein [Actinomycetia bacterium]|nr:Aliphatic sulfonates transporter substrate-binding protein [Actinomycetes bacterium]
MAVSTVLALTMAGGIAAAAGAGAAEPRAASGATMTIGYSAWPGWFPLLVGDQTGIFKKAGLNVKLKYFANYTGSLDALSAGRLDANAQTLNDTMAAVAAGSKQTIVVTGDNSAGNDAVICDKSVGNSIKDLKGKTIAAEEGVVDHYLLLQGLESVGMTQSDIDFRGSPTDAAAGAFAGGQFDCVAVFAPFTVQALTRPGSHVVFSSKDFPGAIPDHIVFSASFVKAHPKDVQKFVNAWYKTLDYITANPAKSTAIMAKKAELSTADYDSLAKGTKLFTATEAVAAFTPGSSPASLQYEAKKINPFLVSSGLTKKQASLKGLFAPQFTKAYLKANAG